MDQKFDFSQFARKSRTAIKVKDTGKAIVYTRVSSKEQANTNLSLQTQRKSIDEYAARNKIHILEYFGGTYESAKTDGRKEFRRMLDYVKHNPAISSILVYSFDRFSRTGGDAIKIAQDLLKKYGVNILAITQPIATNNPSGALQQNIHFIFSNYDNDLRKIKAVAGMKEKFLRGDWVVRTPFGYDTIKINGERKIVLNDKGKLIAKAFEWKAQGEQNKSILGKLQARGLPLQKQKLTKIFANPFYCGKIAHGILDGQIVNGNHDKAISEELFLRVNNIRINSKGYGLLHKNDNEFLPLNVFLKCGQCNQPFTGYIVKRKGIHYYKCRTAGCKCNRNAEALNQKFSQYLTQFQFKPDLMPLLKRQLELILEDSVQSNGEEKKLLQRKLKESSNKLEALEDKFYLESKMPQDVFERLKAKCESEIIEIQKEIGKLPESISNPEKAINRALDLSRKLSTTWTLEKIAEKKRLQKLVFPQGVVYERENDAFRTPEIACIFELIAEMTGISSRDKYGERVENFYSSLSAEREVFEPTANLGFVVFSQ